ncbi:rap1 GTPase-GDP dissociation stimulator 1-like isoform X2 [Asterias rubens]|uniref:rap1 GTPase-GDP dissociation stimulator 1-like isoform X2 n=1 Tax=Asterias rubens TaxID=7604 RepID=UPI0014559CBE|nr:rap1 GTPase-GDP dissociation stimulator 1-like isoform X2 [Asterias rubens]XP_033643884.1 rap1 GTPase-GDP dissociation stimulator 1-like isoform X2 [Asterias rubens]
MDDLEQAVKSLQLGPSDIDSVSCLDCMLQALEQDVEESSARLLSLGSVTVLAEQLKKTDKEDYLSRLSHIIAEMAKNESIRDPFVDAGVIPTLNGLLSHRDTDVVVQVCRALGNICCDHDKARQAIHDSEGVERLLELLKSRATPDTILANQKVRVVASGYLMNLTYANGTLQTKVRVEGGVGVMVTLMSNFPDDINLCGKIIMCIGNIAELEENKEVFVNSGITELLIKALKIVGDDEQLETIFEVIATLAENDAMKLEFAKGNLVDIIQEQVAKFSDHEIAQGSQPDDEFDIERVASDIIILLLTGDESMKYLFNNGQSSLFKKVMSDWVSSPCDLYQISGALAIGNFARNDEHCIRLVELGVLEPLLKLLKRPEGEDLDMRLGHAVLSALKNLAIPKVNKPLLLKTGIIEVILPLLKLDMHPVVFKLLGTCRMLIDGQGETAVSLGQNVEFIDRVADLCDCEIHAGVSGEANRLLAALIKHSANTQVMHCIIEHGGMSRLVAMAMSEHTLMQNEALIALTLLSSTQLDNEAVQAFMDANLLAMVSRVLKSNQTTPEIQCNVLSLVGFLSQSDVLKAAMIQDNLMSVIDTLATSNCELLKRKAVNVREHFT